MARKADIAEQFTPGPWTAWINGEFVEVRADEHSRKPVIKWSGFVGRPHKEQVANAYLIAAAPELYAACQFSRDAIAKQRGFGKAWPKLEAALVKARGEA